MNRFICIEWGYLRIASIFAAIDRCESAQWERAGAGLTLRIGAFLLAFGHIGYRDKDCPWPKWLRFGLSIHGPANLSMSSLPKYYLYLFGRRIFDTTYWERRSAPRVSVVILPILAALAGAVALSGCQSTGSSAISAASIQANAKSALVTFCATGLPAAEPLAGELNGQMQANYQTVSRACAMVGNGQSVNVVTAALAALALYDGLKATYPKAFTALASEDVASLRRITVDAARAARF